MKWKMKWDAFYTAHRLHATETQFDSMIFGCRVPLVYIHTHTLTQTEGQICYATMKILHVAFFDIRMCKQLNLIMIFINVCLSRKEAGKYIEFACVMLAPAAFSSASSRRQCLPKPFYFPFAFLHSNTCFWICTPVAFRIVAACVVHI